MGAALEVLEVERSNVGVHPDEALGPEILHHDGVGDDGGQAQREGDGETRSDGQREHWLGHVVGLPVGANYLRMTLNPNACIGDGDSRDWK